MGKKSREEIYQELVTGRTSGVDTFEQRDSEGVSEERKKAYLKLQNQMDTGYLPHVRNNQVAGAPNMQNGLQPGDEGYIQPDADQRALKSWNMGWGSVKASFGAGMEWIGVENEMKSLETFGKNLKHAGQQQIANNYLPTKDFEYADLVTPEFWTDKAPTVIPSMLSLMGPAVLAGMAGTLGTATSMGALWGAAALEPGPFGEAALGTVAAIGGIAAASGLSRTLEGIMEAGGSYDEALKIAKDKGYSEREAQQLAGNAAAQVFRKNWALVGMDAAEFALAFAPLKGIGGATKAAKFGQRLAKKMGKTSKSTPGFKSAMKKSADKLATDQSILDRISSSLPKSVTVTSSLVAQAAMEGAEEVYQAWISSEAINEAQGKPQESFQQFFNRPETQEAMVLGALGGLGMGVGSQTLGAIKNATKSKEEKKFEQLKKKTARFGKYMESYQKANTDQERAAATTSIAYELFTDYVKEGKNDVVRHNIEARKKAKKIDQAQYDQLMGILNLVEKTYDSLPKKMKPEAREEAITLVARKAALETEIAAYTESNKDMDAKILESNLKVQKGKIEKIDERLNYLLFPEEYESTVGKEQEVEKPEPVPEDYQDLTEEEQAEVDMEANQPEPEFVSEPIEEEKPAEGTAEEQQETEEEFEFQSEEIKEEQEKEPAKRTPEQAAKYLSDKVEKSKEPVTGSIEKPGNNTKDNSYDFVDDEGNKYRFYDKKNNVTIEDLNQPAAIKKVTPQSSGLTKELQDAIVEKDGKQVFYFPNSKGRKYYDSILQVRGKGRKLLGNIRTSGDSEFKEQPKSTTEDQGTKTAKEEGKEEALFEVSEPKGEKSKKRQARLKEIKEEKEKVLKELKNKAGLTSGIPLHTIPEFLELGRLTAEEGFIHFQEWLAEVTKKLKEAGLWDKIMGDKESRLKTLWRSSVYPGQKETQLLEEIFGIELPDMDASELMAHYSAESRMLQNITTIRQAFKPLEMRGISFGRVMSNLYKLTHDPGYDEGNLKGEIDKLSTYGQDGKEIAGWLGDGDVFTDEQLVSIFVTLSNLKSAPFLYMTNPNGKIYNLAIANTANEMTAKYTSWAQKRLDEISESEFKKYMQQFDLKRDELMEQYAEVPNKENKYKIVQLELKVLSFLTSPSKDEFIDWSPFVEAYKQDYDSYKDYYFSHRFNGYPLNKSILYNSIFTKKDGRERAYLSKAEFENNIINQGQIAKLTSSLVQPNSLNYGITFSGGGTTKYGLVESSDILDQAENVHNLKGKFFKDNVNVKHFAKLGRGMKWFLYDSTRNSINAEGKSPKDLTHFDAWALMINAFLSNSNALGGKEHYPQIIEKLSDKPALMFVESIRYDLKAADKELEAIRKADLEALPKSDEKYINELKGVVRDLVERKIISGETNIAETAELFYKNYMVNKYYNDKIFFGADSNYKNGYVDQTKRAGSSASNGKKPNTKVDGGLKPTFKNIVLKDDTIDLRKYHKDLPKDFDVTDGVMYISPEFSEAHKASYGSIYNYHTSIKAIYSKINPETGARELLKSHAIVLNDDMVEMFPELKPYREMLKKVDVISFTSSAKLAEVNDEVSTMDKPKVIERDSKSWRVQNDLRRPESLDDKNLPVQLMRYMMEFKDRADQMQEEFNENISGAADALIKQIKAENFEDEFRSFLLSRISETENNQDILRLLNNGVSVLHPYINKTGAKIWASHVEKEMLNTKINGAIYTTVALPGVEIKPYRVEDGKVIPGEAYVPYEYSGSSDFFASRVPISGFHSTAYLKVKKKLPKSVGSIIIMSPEMNSIAGEDFDGDQRHIWSKYNNKELTVAQERANKAFDNLKAIYTDPNNYERIIEPISIGESKENTKGIKQERPNKYTPQGFMKAFQDNMEGSKMIGITARANAIYSWLGSINAELKSPIPIIKYNDKGEYEGVENMVALQKDQKVRRANARNLNIAVDNAKEQLLELMGLNQAVGITYYAMEHFGVDEKTLINFMNQPVIKKYITFYRKLSSEVINSDPFSALGFYVEQNFEKESVKDFWKMIKNPAAVSSYAEREEYRDLATLANLHSAINQFKVYRKINNLINISEKGIKSYQEYLEAKDLLEYFRTQNQLNRGRMTAEAINIGDLFNSKFVTPAKIQVKVMGMFYDKVTAYETMVAKMIRSKIEKYNSVLDGKYYVEDDQIRVSELGPLSKTQTTALMQILDKRLMQSLFKGEKSRSQIIKEARSAYGAMKKKADGNMFISSLELDDTGRVVLKKRIRNTNFGEDIEYYREDFERMDQNVKDAFIRYAISEFGLTGSTWNGSFATMFDVATHKKIGSAMEKQMKEWKSMDSFDITETELRSIMEENPLIVPEANVQDGDVFMNVFANDMVVPPQAYPYYVIGKNRFGEKIIYKRQGKGNKAYYIEDPGKTSSRLRDFSQIIDQAEDNEIDFDVKEQTIDPLFAVPAENDSELNDYVREELEKLYPGVKVFSDPKAFNDYVEKHVGKGKTVVDMETFAAAFMDAVFVNPKKEVQTSRLHEYAHLYFDALPDEDFKRRTLKLFNNNEEALIEAIAQAGVDMSKVNLSGSALEKFIQRLRIFWSKVKQFFGMSNREETARILAQDLMTNAAGFNIKDFETRMIKQQGNVKVPKSVYKSMIEAINDEINKVFEGKNLTLLTLNYNQFRRLVTGHNLDENPGENFREKTYYYYEEKGQQFGYQIVEKEDGKRVYKVLGRSQWLKRERMNNDITWAGLSEKDKKVMDLKYQKYVDDFLFINELWKDYENEKQMNQNLLKGRGKLANTLKKLQNKDRIAREHLERVLTFEMNLAQFLDRAKSEKDSDVKTFTSGVYDVVVLGDKAMDMDNPLVGGKSSWISGSFSMVSPQGAASPVAQMRQLEFERYSREAQEASTDSVKKLINVYHDIVAFAKKNNVANPFIVNEKKEGLMVRRNNKGRLVWQEPDKIKTTGNAELDEMVKGWMEQYRNIMVEYDHYQDFSKVFYVHFVNADVPELIKRSYQESEYAGLAKIYDAIWKTVVVKTAGGINYDQAYINTDYSNSPVKFSDFKAEMLKPENTDTLPKRVAAIREIRKKERWLKQRADSTIGTDAAGNLITQSLEQQIGTGTSVDETSQVTLDLGASAHRHVQGVVRKHFMAEFAPAAVFYYDLAKGQNNDYWAKWMKLNNDKVLYGEQPESMFGPYGELIQWFINLTAIRYLALNPMGAMFNAIAGFTQTFTHFGFAPVLKGMRRIVTGYGFTNFDKGLITSTAIRFFQRYDVVNTSQDTEISVTSKTLGRISNIIFSPITFVEYINHAYTTIGLMSDEQWKAVIAMDEENNNYSVEDFKEEYGKRPEEAISTREVGRYVDESRRIHGAYHPFNQRLINTTPEGRMIMQFKNWLPDVVLAHFQTEYVDMNGVVRKGILNSTGGVAANLFKSVFIEGDIKKTKKNLENLSDIDKKNLHKFMREALMMTAVSMLIASLGEGSDDDRRKLQRVLGDIGFIYDLDNYNFILDSPIPIAGTMMDMMNATYQVSKVVVGSGEQYQRDAKYGQKGEYKAPVMIVNLLPGHRLIKDIFYELK